MAKFPEDFVPVAGFFAKADTAMNESKVEVIFGHDCNVSTAYTTHADYRALEDENRSLRASFDEAHDLWVKATKELASIKARVGEGQ